MRLYRILWKSMHGLLEKPYVFSKCYAYNHHSCSQSNSVTNRQDKYVIPVHTRDVCGYSFEKIQSHRPWGLMNVSFHCYGREREKATLEHSYEIISKTYFSLYTHAHAQTEARIYETKISTFVVNNK